MAVVISAIAGVGATTYVEGLIASQFLAALAGAVVSGIVGSALISRPSVGNFNAQATSILLNKQSNNEPIPVIYGTRRVGGTVVWLYTHGDITTDESVPLPTDRKYLTAFLVVSEGEIESYEGFWFSGRPSTDFKFINDLWIEERYGTEDQIGFSRITKVMPDYGENTHRLAGTAYLWVTMFYNATHTVYPEGVPVINTLVKGVKTFDPRSSLIEWSDNPILCVRDYLTHERYGRGIDASLIDDASFTIAANYCDELVAYNGIDSIKRYTCNGVAETQNSSLSIIKQLLSSCRGLLIFSGGLYKIIIDKPEIAVFTFSEDNIIGGWKIKLGDKKSKFNRIRANFFNESKEFQADIAVVDKPDLRSLDGGLLEIMIDLPFTSDIIRAKAIAFFNLNQSRYPITCEFTSTIEALRVEVGDVVYINHKTPAWDTHNSNLGKKFRIMRVTLQNNDEVRIMANEYADEVYDLDIIDPPFIPSKIDINDLSVCLPPTNLFVKQTVVALITGDHRVEIEVSWDASPDDFIVNYEIAFKFQYESNWLETQLTDNLFWNSIAPRTTEYLDIKIRSVNTIGVKSIWLE
jgi:hypothetical protein